VVKTTSRVDVPINGMQLPSHATVAGVAFGGDRGISKVEVSTDGGRSWRTAELRSALGAYTWRQWLYRFAPEASSGDATILVRATDATGNVQTPVEAQPFPSGASGYDSVSVSL
jgi:Mo-co oxidoreductase dimerisation domain